MSKTLNYSIVEAIVTNYGLGSAKENLLSDLESKINEMPSYMNLFVKLFSSVFDYTFVFIYMSRFSKLNLRNRVRIITLIKSKNIPLYALYLKLFETITIINALERNE